MKNAAINTDIIIYYILVLAAINIYIFIYLFIAASFIHFS